MSVIVNLTLKDKDYPLIQLSVEKRSEIVPMVTSILANPKDFYMTEIFCEDCLDELDIEDIDGHHALCDDNPYKEVKEDDEEKTVQQAGWAMTG